MTVLPHGVSITNKSLITLGEEMGLKPQRRPLPIEEIFDYAEAGCCGTAAVITPIRSITYRDRKAVYAKDDQPGKHCVELYNKLTAIQRGDEPDPYGWVHKVPAI